MLRPVRDTEDVWSFSPLIDLSIYRWVTRNLRRPHSTGRFSAGADRRHAVRHQPACALYPHTSSSSTPTLAGRARHLRHRPHRRRHSAEDLERDPHRAKLEEQRRLLLEARLDALQRRSTPTSSSIPSTPSPRWCVPARAGPRDDRQAGQHPARPAQGPRGLRALPRRAGLHRRLPRHRGGPVWARS